MLYVGMKLGVTLLRDGCRSIVFKNGVQMRVFEYERDEVTGGFKEMCVIGES
jgi:hypothetical protein